MEICWIGFGEAGSTFAAGMRSPSRAFDLRTDPEMQAAISAAGVSAAASHQDAVRGAGLILSLVTADQAVAAAGAVAASNLEGALYCDMNSVAPDTKRAAAQLIGKAGGRYVDVAVMAPVKPQARSVPLLLSGEHSADAVEALRHAGFSSINIVGGDVGAASAVKMIRSVMVKGVEALSAECALAAQAAGVLDRVVTSLDASSTSDTWAERFNYNLDRMLVHGERRAAEMEEVVKTLDALGTGSQMSRATAQRQRELGSLRISPSDDLTRKLQQIGVAA